MNPFSLTGIIIVQIALIFYSIAILSEQRKRLITSGILAFLTLGVLFDITATTFMIIGSSRGVFTLHGLLGYSSLAGMLADTILIWRFSRAHKPGERVTNRIHWYSLGAYLWWITAYITGGLLVALRHA